MYLHMSLFFCNFAAANFVKVNDNEQNTYNPPQPPMPPGPPMPPPPVPPFASMPPQPGQPMRQRKRMTWKERLFAGSTGRPLTLRQEMTMPDWAVGKSVYVFFIAFAACTLVFGYPMELRDAIISSASLLLFFYGGRAMLSNWARNGEKTFLKNVFIFGLLARLAWSMYCYFFFNPEYYGNHLGDEADTTWYMPYGAAIAEWIKDGFPVPFSDLMKTWGSAIDDTGYPFWLAIINLVSFGESDVFIPFVVKCLVGAYCGVCIYRVAKRHFGAGAGRLAALFVALNPNIIYWCGNMFKEAELMFLCCLCVDYVDRALSSGAKLTFKTLLPGVLVAMYIFFFRAALAIVFFLAIFAHIVMASDRVMSAGKKVIAGVMVGVVLLVGMGDRIRSQAENIRGAVQSDQQATNMQWRAKRSGGNAFAAYASKTVFAPLIFTIPFPTFNQANEGQILQRQLSGGNYIKNIFSFFVILIMFLLLISGEWRKHVFILAYTLGYLMTLVLSSFAQSSRFHMPIWPMLMLFAAYGIQISKRTPKYRRWFVYALVIEVVACLAWNWFKLKGRGMI